MPALAPMSLDLRQRLLHDSGNVELRQKYLATRPPAWIDADRRHAHGRLLLARLLRGTLGLTVVGAVGGEVGVQWLGTAAAVPVATAVGSILSSAASFALLGALGCVVLPEVVGEEKTRRQGRGTTVVLAQFLDSLAEAGCGGIWGALCVLAIGLLAGVADGVLELQSHGPSALGAVGGMLLGVVFGAIVLRGASRQPGRLAHWWAELGPLPVTAYLFSRRAAQRRYLRK